MVNSEWDFKPVCDSNVSFYITEWNGIRFQGIYLRRCRSKQVKRPIYLTRNVIHCPLQFKFSSKQFSLLTHILIIKLQLRAVTHAAALATGMEKNGLENVIVEPSSEQHAQLACVSRTVTPLCSSFTEFTFVMWKISHLVKYNSCFTGHSVYCSIKWSLQLYDLNGHWSGSSFCRFSNTKLHTYSFISFRGVNWLCKIFHLKDTQG